MEELTTLKENKDFLRLYAKGKSFVSPVLVTYVMKNRVKKIRYGITASKKTGIAVQRNRSRRVIKEAFRQMYPALASNADLKCGYDFVFVARGKTPFVKCKEVQQSMQAQLKKAGVLK